MTRRKSKSWGGGGAVKTLLYGGGIVLLITTFFLLTLRFVNPPGTMLMVVRYVERELSSGSAKNETAQGGWMWKPLRDISPNMQRAVIVAEDARFLQHRGIDLGSLFSVIEGEKRKSRRARGASTITMQTVKNLFLWPGRSYIRKGVELIASVPFDLLVGKRRVLEIYLNIVEWGPGVYGVEAASRRYFDKSAKSLTSSESAALAAVLPSPLTTSPRALTPVARKRYSRIVREAPAIRLP